MSGSEGRAEVPEVPEVKISMNIEIGGGRGGWEAGGGG